MALSSYKKRAVSAGTEASPCLSKEILVNNTAKNSKKSRDERTRNWTFVAYPESAPADWREILDNEHIEWVESPLHDKDIDGAGKQKKPHWHIALLFAGKKSYEQIKEIADKINAPKPEPIQSTRSLIRYFAHLDDPNKAQYPVSEIIAHGGTDLKELLKPTASSRYESIAEMVEYIQENEITEFIDFMIYCKNKEFETWFPLLCDNAAFIIQAVIKSNRHKPSSYKTDISGLAESISEV